MQRRELQKAIRRYAKEVNFHKYGLIRQLLKLKERRWEYLKTQLKEKEVICPNCCKSIMYIECSDSEYDSSEWLCCDYCGECLDEDDDRAFAYIDVYNKLLCEDYFDSLLSEVVFSGNVGDGHEWQLYCEKVIRGLLAEGVGV